MPNQQEINALLAETQQLVEQTSRELGNGGAELASLVGMSAPKPAPAKKKKDVEPRVQRVLSIEVPVIVRLGERHMNLRDVLNWTLGSIVEFEKKADAPLDLLINNKRIGCGIAIKVGENFGLHLADVGTRTERLQAMAPSIT